MSGSRIFREVGSALLFLACGVSSLHPLMGLDPNRALHQYSASRWQGISFPGGAVHAIAQTNDGYLWIGSQAGLVQFDGTRFRLFDHANTPSLPSGPVLGLVVDSEGVLWLRMESAHLFRYSRGFFEQAHPRLTDDRGVTIMTRDHAGRVLAAALNVILRFTAGNTGRGASSGRVGGLAISIAETEDGVVWLGMRDNGLFRVHRDSRLQVSGLPDQKINALLAGTGSELWIGTDSGLVRWNGSAATQHGVPDQLAHGPILALARDRDSNLWVSTRSDIVRVDTHGISSTLAGHFGVGAIHAMFEDREGNLWLGGPGGLVQLRDSPFVTYEGLNGGALHVDDDGRAWFAPSGGGLLWTDGRARHAISVAGLDTDVIYSICSGSEHLWVGRRLGGLTRLREVEGQFTAKTYSTEDGIARGGIYALHCSGDGSVWAGSLAGSITRIHQGRISTFTSSDGLSGEAITTINETPDGVIWAGTAGGLHSFDGGAWKSLTGADGLPPGRVNSLVVDEKGVLWIGAAAGLLYWTGTRAELLSQAAELLRAEILGIVSDRRGNLWVASEGHIFRVARDSLLTKRKALTAAVREFGTADGLPSTRAVRRDHPVRIDPSGRIWFALHGGVSVIDPTRARVLPPASVIVESITVDGQPLKHETLARYTADRRRIVFNFNGLSLSFPDRVRYRYRLDDYDSDWSQPTQSREVAYTNLPPGRYTFRLMASNGEGLWNGSEVSVDFEAEPRFWQIWWFRVAGAVLVLTAIVMAYRDRLSRIRAAMNLRFEERLAERTRIAQELHDTLLQGFLSAAMQLQVAADIMPENTASRPLVARALQLMQQVIEEGRNAVQGLRATGSVSVPLESALSQTWRDIGAADSVDFRVIVEGRRRELHPVVQDELYRIGREALMNAFRHARARHVEVELTYAPDSFRMFVRDDGEGIDPAILQNGREGHWGLIGMRERAERLGAQLHVFSRASAGTEVLVELPARVAFYDTAKK